MALPKLTTIKYEMTIPSSKKTIEYRPYNVKEEKVLLLSKEANDQKGMVRAVRDLIYACTFGEIDPKTLTMFDFEYMFLQLRAKSVGETSDIKMSCSECETYNEISINIEDANIKGEISRDMKVQITDEIGVVMRWPMFTMAEKYVTANQKSSAAMIDMIIDCIECIYDKEEVYPANEQSPKELKEFVDNMPSSVFKEIASKIDGAPSVGLDINFKCKKCSADNDVTLEGLANFF